MGLVVKRKKDKDHRTIFVAVHSAPRAGSMRQAIYDAIGVVAATLDVSIEVRSNSELTGVAVLTSLQELIRQADLVIADLSVESPSVLLEVGFARELGKPILLLSNDVSRVPYEFQGMRILLYDKDPLIGDLVPRLTESLVYLLPGPSSKGKAEKLATQKSREKAFISYSHADQEFLLRILVHLRPLERDGILDLWSDTKLKAGDKWRTEIQNAVSKARIAVMLISADFLASDFIVTDELPPLLVAAEKRGTRIIPVIVKPSRFVRDERLARFQALNDPKNPVIRMTEGEREELYARLAETVELELGAFSNSVGPTRAPS